MRFLIIGAGCAGAVVAERLATAGHTCTVVVRRPHIAGNCYDSVDSSGVLLHRYGPHYFRTNSLEVESYLSRFTSWIPANYVVNSYANSRLWQFPINLNTFEQLIGRPSDPEEMRVYLARNRVDIPNPANSEEVVLSQVGWELYRLFFEGYTQKQWGIHPSELSPEVCGRIPLRMNRGDRYVTDRFQMMPSDGYTAMFSRILNHKNITLRLETTMLEAFHDTRFDWLVYSGPLDQYFSCVLGTLPYRSLRFEYESFREKYHQPVVQVNYPNEHDYTRTVEIKHVTGQKLPVTTIAREYPAATGEPYYPVPTTTNAMLARRYAALAKTGCPRTVFVGRLACYRYQNMDCVIASALRVAENFCK